jgi:putative membrane protein
MANERTFLAWIRTSIGIMAFGFLIEKFIIPFDSGDISGGHDLIDGHQYVTFLGIFLVSLGAVAGLLATYRFRKTEKQIMEDTYHPSIVADILIAILLASIGILMVIYLINKL